MKLDKDCIRDIMLCIEKLEEFVDVSHTQKEKALRTISLDTLCKDEYLSEKYSPEKISYHYLQAKDYHFIDFKESEERVLNSVIYRGLKNFHVKNITPIGHEFLDCARNDEIWNDIKNDIEKARLIDCSLNVLLDVLRNKTFNKIAQQ